MKESRCSRTRCVKPSRHNRQTQSDSPRTIPYRATNRLLPFRSVRFNPRDDTLDETDFGSGGGPVDPGSTVMRFRYLGDPLFILSCALYVLNRYWLKAQFHTPLLHGQFNDLLLIPCALPPLLLLHRWMGLRAHDDLPTAGEVAGHLLVWSVLFEWIGPHLMQGKTGDPLDVVAYAAGGMLAWLWWRRSQWRMPFARAVNEL